MNAPTNPEHLSFEQEFERHFPAERIANIVRKYNVPEDKVPMLRHRLFRAVSLFLLNGGWKDEAIAPKQDIADLLRLLTKVRRKLKEPGVEDRLWMGEPLDDDDPTLECVIIETEEGQFSRFPALEKLRAEREELKRLLDKAIKAAKSSSEIPGQVLAHLARQREQFRLAAGHIHGFWAYDLGRAPSVQNRGGRHTAALDFILDCLRCIDPKVKEASFRNFERLSNEQLAADYPGRPKPVWPL